VLEEKVKEQRLHVAHKAQEKILTSDSSIGRANGLYETDHEVVLADKLRSAIYLNMELIKPQQDFDMNDCAMNKFLKSHADEHLAVANQFAKTCLPVVAKAAEAALFALKSKKKILFFGNGGSAADAQHLATELTVRYRKNRQALASIALSTDTSALTAIGNDFSFDQLFSRQVEALAHEGDLVLGISTSGSSPNVAKGLETAKALGCVTVLFTGEKHGSCEQFADMVLNVPSGVTARIQECHILAGHMFCEIVDAAF
jgi:D-sedoheptulose 7-phosphate isomerase